MIAIETAGDFLSVGGIGKKVTCELPDGELVEWEVIIESLNDPVSPDPLPCIAILLKAITVGVASGIKPWKGHAFAVVRAGEESVNEFFPGIGAGVIDEGFDFGGGGGESDEVDGKAFDECSAVSFGGGLEVIFFKFCEDEVINGILGPCGVFDGGETGAFRRSEGPVCLPWCSGGNPVMEDLFLLGRELSAGIRGWHE